MKKNYKYITRIPKNDLPEFKYSMDYMVCILYIVGKVDFHTSKIAFIISKTNLIKSFWVFSAISFHNFFCKNWGIFNETFWIP